MQYLKNKSLFITLFTWIASSVFAASIESAVDETLDAHKEAREAQLQIDQLAAEKSDLLTEYRMVLQKTDSLNTYNKQLEKLVTEQNKSLSSLTNQLNHVEDTQRNIVPLMLEMIDVLANFIQLDLPFLKQERETRIEFLREMMDNPDVSLPEKYRRIMEAYQIELEYGRTIEAYNDTIQFNGGQSTVDVLRVGRMVLVYQTLDGKHSGYWHPIEKTWQTLPSGYLDSIAKGIKIARKQSPPELIKLPLLNKRSE